MQIRRLLSEVLTLMLRVVLTSVAPEQDYPDDESGQRYETAQYHGQADEDFGARALAVGLIGPLGLLGGGLGIAGTGCVHGLRE